jgi:hypothetical protein
MRAQLAGPSPRYMSAQARVDAALRASADPLDRAVADWLNVGSMRAGSGASEAVVQLAATTTDPRLYSLAYGLCHSAPPPPAGCSGISLARWTEIDGGNGITWLALLGQARARGDAAGVQAAMTGLASATRIDLYFFSAAGAVASHAPQDDGDLAPVADLAAEAMGRSAALVLPSFQPLIQVCRAQSGGDEELARACRSISDVMVAHSDNLLSRSIGGALWFATTGDASWRDAIRADYAALAAVASPVTGLSECHDMRKLLDRFQRFAAVGELEGLREQARSVVTP